MAVTDRVGLAWRGERAGDILRHLDAIDALEVIAEDWLYAPRRRLDALAELARARPLTLHGVSLGAASAAPVDAKRLDRLARLVGHVQPAGWSEHLAFVRAGGVEIGHLAAPPRTAATVDGAVANLRRATQAVGSPPAVENVATLIDPPCSTLAEPVWLGTIVRGAGVPLLLDLHNLWANAQNFGHDAHGLLHALPLDHVHEVHLAGGRWWGDRVRGATRARLLDDHLHDVPPEVYALLEALAAAVPQPLTVIVEREGRHPPIEAMLQQLDQARQALVRGRTAARWREAA
ncbi:MAG: DUF692 family protein [Rubrivivax sp.]